MSKERFNNKGFSAIFIILGIAFIVIVLFVLQDIFLAPADKKILNFSNKESSVFRLNNQTGQERQPFSKGECKKIDKLVFTHDITDLTKIKNIVPPGTMEPEELRSHTYLLNKNPDDKLPVYAPTDITLTSGAYFNREGKRQNEYQLFFTASCDYSLRFGHITEPVEKIRVAFPSQPGLDSREIQVSSQVSLKAGELIGYTTGNYPNHIWDFGVYDINHQNKFANPERFKEHFRLLHAVCPYDFFTYKNDYYKLLTNINGSPRSDCGGVEQDVVGTIAGQWFGNPIAANSQSTWEKFIGVSEFLSPGQIRIVGLGDSYMDSMWIEKNNNPTYKNPTEVRDEHCYSDGQQLAYFKLLAPDKLAFYYQKGGACPKNFPQSGYKVFVR